MIEYIQTHFGEGFTSAMIMGAVVCIMFAIIEILVKTLILGQNIQSVMERADKNCLKEFWVSIVVSTVVVMLMV